MTNIIHSIDNIEIKLSEHRKYSYLYSITKDDLFTTFFSLFNIPYTLSDREIHFESKTIISLENYLLNHKKLSTDAILKLIYDIGFIIKTLEKQGNCIFAFSLRDIVILNGEIFMFVNPFKIVEIKDGQAILKSPINLNESFISPEIKIDSLPIRCNLGFTYYSFGLLVLYLITKTRYSLYDRFSDDNSNKDILSDLKHLCGSKLYFFILRCLDEKQFLYI